MSILTPPIDELHNCVILAALCVRYSDRKKIKMERNIKRIVGISGLLIASVISLMIIMNIYTITNEVTVVSEIILPIIYRGVGVVLCLILAVISFRLIKKK